MGTAQSCCGKGKEKSEDSTAKKYNSLNSLKPIRSSSVPLILKQGSPAYECVKTPKNEIPNGHVSEKNLLEILHKPISVSSDPQNSVLVPEDKENQSLLAKTLTTPNLDKDDAKLAPEQIWEHTQSLDTFKLLTSEQEEEEEIMKNVDKQFIEIRVKRDDTKQGESESEIMYIEKQDKCSSQSSSKSCKVVEQEEHSEHRLITNELDNDQQNVREEINHQECRNSIEQGTSGNEQKVVEAPNLGFNTDRASKSSGNTTSSGDPKYCNIFDIEFRRHNERVAKSNYNSFPSTYQEVLASTSPKPKIETQKSAPQCTITEPTAYENGTQIWVKAEINVTSKKENSASSESDMEQSGAFDHLENNDQKLYSAVVKEGTLPKKK